MRKDSEILRDAQRLIGNFEYIQICQLIWRATGTKNHKLALWVQEMLRGDLTCEHWLLNHGIPGAQLTYENMREYRLRWIGHLIEICEREGA